MLLSLKSIQNLRALHLENFEDFSFLGDLKTLEIFSLRGFMGHVEGLANELVRLESLKILDLTHCPFRSSTLPAYVIEKLFKLEELYLEGLETSEEILAVINLSPRLTALSLSIRPGVIRKNYVFPKVVRYDIKDGYGALHLTQKSWKINAPDIPYYLVSLLYEDLESLVLDHNIEKFMEVLLTDKSLKLSNLKLLHLHQNRFQLSRLRELPNQQVRLEGLVDLKIVNFPSLESLFPLSIAKNLVLLETLEIRECNGLEQIVTESEGNEEEISSTINSHSPLCFPKLRKLQVGNCDGLKYIFPTLMAPQGLQRLTLSVEKCRQLEQLIRHVEDRVENDLLLQQQLEFLRSLPSFSVWDCPHLTDSLVHLEPTKAYLAKQEVGVAAFQESFSRSKEVKLRAIEGLECLVDNTTTENGPPSSAFTNLEILALEEIYGLETLCKGRPPQGFLKNLKLLDVGSCNKLQVVLYNKEEINQEQRLSNLQSLQLRALPELSRIFKGSVHSFTLQSLKFVNIYDCGKLESLFSSSLIRSLQLLEELNIGDCDALETLFSELENDVEKEAKSSSSPPLCLPKLKILKISDCPKLEYVVPITLAQGFPALALLSVTLCGELKQVFSMPNRNHGVEHNRILSLPSLEDLHLSSLDNLTSFVPENYIVEAPALESLRVNKCPSLMNFPIQQVNNQLNLEVGSLSTFKGILCNTKHLTLTIIWHENLVLEYLDGLTSLHINVLNDVKCLVDGTLTEAMMGSKYKGQPPKLLSNLEHLRLRNSSGLRWIIKGSSNCFNFRSLKVLSITLCHGLEYLFPLPVLQTLRLLEEIEIDWCRKLKSLFVELESDDNDDIGIESNTLCLPNLKTVKIKRCQSLEYVFPRALTLGFPSLQKLHLDDVGNLRSIVAGNNFLEAPALEMLFIRGCSEITNFTIRKQFNIRFPLKELTINWESEDNESCRFQPQSVYFLGNFERLFETRGGYFLSTLEAIDLRNLIWLRDIWKAPPIHVATNLSQLVVSRCNNLTHIFPVKLIPYLPHLVTLTISSCEKLKQIISNGDDDILASSSQGVQLMEMKMIFPQLKEIYLSELSSLESFSPGGYHLEFPCLESLRVYHCSNMITSFTVDYVTLTVHAKTDQASQIGDTSSWQEDIHWKGRKPTSLPQYVEEAEEISPLK